MKSCLKIYFLFLLLSIFAPVASTFLVNRSSSRTLLSTEIITPRHNHNPPFSSTKLFLHVEPIHQHRDTIVRLDDPVKLEEKADTTNARKHYNLGNNNNIAKNNQEKHNKALHRFTNHIAPWVLALYLIGHFLNTYHSEIPGMDDSGNMAIDPAFGGSILIGAGLFMIKWSIDKVLMLE